MNLEKSASQKRGYDLFYRNEGVFLRIYPLNECGKVVGVSEVLSFLNDKKLKEYENDKIVEAVEREIGTEVKIAPPQDEYKIDAKVEISISRDKMEAYMFIIPPDGGEMLSAQKLLDAVNNQKVIFGIDHEKIEAISRYPVYNQNIIVAKGQGAVNGLPGKMKYHFQMSKNMIPKILDDGRVDFRQLDLIENVHTGDVLITAIPPTQGTNGKNVFGEKIPAIPGKPVVLPRGKNVEVSEDGLKLLAGIDGQVVVGDKKVNVYSLYEVGVDVDNSTGNIEFVGNVVVKGNVLTGFSIKAGGTVEIRGVVEGATIEASGDIILHRGMQGIGKGTLITEGNIVAKYIENSTLIAKGNIKSEAIMHSSIQCGGSLVLGGKKGLIVGGTAKVGKEVIAKVVGSPMATTTEIEVGLDPAIRQRSIQLKGQISNAEVELKKADQAINLLKKLESVGKLDKSKKIILIKSIKTKTYLGDKMSELKQEYDKIAQKIQEEGKGKIKVQDIVYPGTKLSIGSCVMYIKEDVKFSTFYRDQADIRIIPYEK